LYEIINWASFLSGTFSKHLRFFFVSLCLCPCCAFDLCCAQLLSLCHEAPLTHLLKGQETNLGSCLIWVSAQSSLLSLIYTLLNASYFHDTTINQAFMFHWEVRGIRFMQVSSLLIVFLFQCVLLDRFYSYFLFLLPMCQYCWNISSRHTCHSWCFKSVCIHCCRVFHVYPLWLQCCYVYSAGKEAWSNL